MESTVTSEVHFLPAEFQSSVGPIVHFAVQFPECRSVELADEKYMNFATNCNKSSCFSLPFCRYATYKLVQKQPGGEKMVGFTRILHRTKDDILVSEVAPCPFRIQTTSGYSLAEVSSGILS